MIYIQNCSKLRWYHFKITNNSNEMPKSSWLYTMCFYWIHAINKHKKIYFQIDAGNWCLGFSLTWITFPPKSMHHPCCVLGSRTLFSRTFWHGVDWLHTYWRVFYFGYCLSDGSRVRKALWKIRNHYSKYYLHHF